MLLAAALVILATAAIHSVAGELLILRHLRATDGFPRIARSDVLAKRTVHATWHLASVLAVGYAAILGRYHQRGGGDPFVLETIAISLFVCAVVVLVGTRGRHPGWVALAAAAVLTWLGGA